MAFHVKDKAGNFNVRFNFGGREFTRSLKTTEKAVADKGVGLVEETLMRLERGWLTLPPDAEPGAFIISGGKRVGKATVESTVAPTVESLFDIYRQTLTTGSKADSSRLTERVHITHLIRYFGAATEFASILAVSRVQGYVDWRSKGGRQPQTIKKELATLSFIANWLMRRNHLPPSPIFSVKHLTFPKGQSKEPFRSWEEIEGIIKGEKLTQARIKSLWECLYLSEEQVKECLRHVQESGRYRFLLPMFALAAYTGARRGEILRCEKKDVDFPNDTIQIREQKADRNKEFTFRPVPLHPTLKTILQAWLNGHPGGRFVICTDNAEPIGERMATKYFRQAISKSRWQVLHGFHTFRHTMASIMASKGKDQRVINAILGHHTEDMERRYRHLFPTVKQQGIADLFA